mmetsp:Transcript_516/g.1376  ORF Transcript_516/g.1376 Transcript_516/m.1376 type:complete len:362 (-) Transcript_516:31-1116(-)
MRIVRVVVRALRVVRVLVIMWRVAHAVVQRALADDALARQQHQQVVRPHVDVDQVLGDGLHQDAACSQARARALGEGEDDNLTDLVTPAPVANDAQTAVQRPHDDGAHRHGAREVRGRAHAAHDLGERKLAAKRKDHVHQRHRRRHVRGRALDGPVGGARVGVGVGDQLVHHDGHRHQLGARARHEHPRHLRHAAHLHQDAPQHQHRKPAQPQGRARLLGERVAQRLRGRQVQDDAARGVQAVDDDADNHGTGLACRLLAHIGEQHGARGHQVQAREQRARVGGEQRECHQHACGIPANARIVRGEEPETPAQLQAQKRSGDCAPANAVLVGLVSVHRRHLLQLTLAQARLLSFRCYIVGV